MVAKSRKPISAHTEKGKNVPKVLAILALTISAAVAVKIDVWWLIGLYWAAVAVYWMNK